MDRIWVVKKIRDAGVIPRFLAPKPLRILYWGCPGYITQVEVLFTQLGKTGERGVRNAFVVEELVGIQ